MLITLLKKNNADNETLQAKVKEYEDSMKNQKAHYEAKVRNLTLDGAIEKALSGAKFKNTDLPSTKIYREKLIIGDDGKVSGLDKQPTSLKKSYKDLFETTVSGITPVNTESNSGITKDQFSKMSYKERVDLYNTNKELYTQLNEQ